MVDLKREQFAGSGFIGIRFTASGMLVSRSNILTFEPGHENGRSSFGDLDKPGLRIGKKSSINPERTLPDAAASNAAVGSLLDF